MSASQNNNKVKTDWIMFGATLASVLLVCIPLVGFPEQSGTLITAAYDILTRQFGVFYLWYGVGLLIFLGWLATTHYGAVKLGDPDSVPEFSTFSWVAMLFSAGVGAGLMYWAVIEWAYYIDRPPFGIEARSTEAIEWAGSYGLFHWGITAWAFYCLPALAIAYPYYCRKIPYLRLSTGVMEFLPNGVNSKRGRFIDFLFI